MPKNYLGLNISHKPFKYNSLLDLSSVDSSFAGNGKRQLIVIMRQIYYRVNQYNMRRAMILLILDLLRGVAYNYRTFDLFCIKSLAMRS